MSLARTHNFAAGDVVVFRHPYRSGWSVGEIQSIGKMYATIDGSRIHIPKIGAKLKDPKLGSRLTGMLNAADSTYNRAVKIAAEARNRARKGLFEFYCEGKVSE